MRLFFALRSENLPSFSDTFLIVNFVFGPENGHEMALELRVLHHFCEPDPLERVSGPSSAGNLPKTKSTFLLPILSEGNRMAANWPWNWTKRRKTVQIELSPGQDQFQAFFWPDFYEGF